MTTQDAQERPVPQQAVTLPASAASKVVEEKAAGWKPTSKEDALTKATTLEATPPKEISDEEREKLHARARDIVERVAKDPKNAKFAEDISNLGLQAQKKAAGQVGMLNERVSDLLQGMKTFGTSDETAVIQHMSDLRHKLNELNPQSVGMKRNWIYDIPILGKLFGKQLEKILRNIATRAETVNDQVEAIIESLRQGQEALLKKNIELSHLRKQIEDQHVVILRNAYLAELVAQQLTVQIAHTEDQAERDRLGELLYDVMMRAYNLRIVAELDLQQFVEIDLTRKNTDRLVKSIDMLLDMGIPAVRNQLVIMIALILQKKMIEAYQQTQEWVENTVVQTAEMVAKHTEDVGAIYKNPFIRLEKVRLAHNKIVEAADKFDQYRLEAIEQAKVGIAELTQMSEELDDRANKLAPKVERTSVEA